MILEKRLSWALLTVGWAATSLEASSPVSGGAPAGYGGAGYANYESSWQQQQQQQGQFGQVGSQEVKQSQVLAPPEQPDPLPLGWTEYFDQASGQPYYHNANDGTTTWERPVSDSTEETQEEGDPGEANNVTEAEGVAIGDREMEPTGGGMEHGNPVESSRESNVPTTYPSDQKPREVLDTEQPSNEQVLTDHRMNEPNPANVEDPIPSLDASPQQQGGPPQTTDPSSPPAASGVEQQRPTVSHPPAGAWGVPRQQQEPQPWGVPSNPQSGESWRHPPGQQNAGGPGVAQDGFQTSQPTMGSSPGSWQAEKLSQMDSPPSDENQDKGHGLEQPPPLSQNGARPSQPFAGTRPMVPPVTQPASANQQVPQQQGPRPPAQQLQPMQQQSTDQRSFQEQPRPYNPSPHQGQSPPPGSYMQPPRQYPMNQQGQNLPPPQMQAPYNQYGRPYAPYGNYGQQQQQPRPQNQLVPQETKDAVRGALGSAWQGILGFGNRTKEAVETAKESVVESAKGAGQQISATSTNLWGQARNTLGSMFEPSPDNETPYSLSGSAGSTGAVPPRNMNPQGQYPPRQPDGRFPYNPQQQQHYGYNPPPGYPQRFPPQQQGPPRNAPPHPNQQQGPPRPGQGPVQNRPPTGQYPPGFRPPQPRGDSPYANSLNPGKPGGMPQQHQPPQQLPPQQAQWGGGPNNNPNWQRGAPPQQQQQQQQQQQKQQQQQQQRQEKENREPPSVWEHPGLDSF